MTCDSANLSPSYVASARNITPETITRLQKGRGLLLKEICMMPEEKLQRSIYRLTHSAQQEAEGAMRWRYSRLVDSTGKIPEGAVSRALKQVEAMRAAQMQRMGINAASVPQTWKWLGPGNIGGRIRALAIHPTRPSEIWVGGVAGGLWKSADSGASWQPISSAPGSFAVSSIVIDTTNPNVMYMGTGEGYFNADAARGAGIFKSTDGGMTWVQLSSTSSADWHYVNKIAISPHNPQVLLAATRTGIWRSPNGGASWTHVKQKLLSGGALGNSGAVEVQFHPTDPNRSIATIHGWDGESGVFHSTDGGQTWMASSGLTPLDTPPPIVVYPRIQLAYSRSNPNLVYALSDLNSGEVYKSSDGGVSYVRVNVGTNVLGIQGWFANAIWVDPTNPLVVVTGGLDLWRSTDGGLTFTKISQFWNFPTSPHADHHAIIPDPGFNGTTNRTVYVANDGGVYRASNISTVAELSGWEVLNNGLGITQFYGAAGSATTGIVVGGTQDNGSPVFTGNPLIWSPGENGGDGGFAAVDPGDPRYIYTERQYLNLFRSSDGGKIFKYIAEDITDLKPEGYCAPGFVAPFMLDPNDSNTMYAAACEVWRSRNIKSDRPVWEKVYTRAIPYFPSWIGAMDVAPSDSNTIWIAWGFGGNLFKTTNANAISPTWSSLSYPPYGPSVGGPGLPTRIKIDPRSVNTVYLARGGYSDTNLFKTLDGGMTWTDISGTGVTGLPQAPVYSIALHPDDPNRLFAGTEVGLFESQNGGGAWQPALDGPIYTPVDDLFWMGKILVAATHGRGIYASAINSAAPTCIDLYETNDGFAQARKAFDGLWHRLNAFCNANDADWFYFDAPREEQYIVETGNLLSGADTVVALYGADGSTLIQTDDNGGGNGASRLIVSLASGRYYVKVTNATSTAASPDMSYDLRVQSLSTVPTPTPTLSPPTCVIGTCPTPTVTPTAPLLVTPTLTPTPEVPTPTSTSKSSVFLPIVRK